jgi:hypothetical protein
MGHLIEQHNDKFSVWSTVTDSYLCENLTHNELIEYLVQDHLIDIMHAVQKDLYHSLIENKYKELLDKGLYKEIWDACLPISEEYIKKVFSLL